MSESTASPPWFLILAILIGICFVAFVVWPSSTIVHLTEDNWEREVVESKIPVVVDFTAEWCGPCKKFAPIVERLAERYAGKVKVAKFDVGNTHFDKARTIAPRYGIRGVPHLLIFNGGEEPEFVYPGGESEGELARAIDGLLARR
jgi:thioredoxin